MKPTLSAIWMITRSQLLATLCLIPMVAISMVVQKGANPGGKALVMLAGVVLTGVFAARHGRKHFGLTLAALCGPLGAVRTLGGWAVLAFLGISFGAAGVSLLLHRYVPGFGAMPKDDFSGGIGFLLAVMAAPLTEEILFRGMVLRRLLQSHSPAAAIGISAALFAAVHVYPVKMLNIFLGALLLGWLYYRTQSIWTGVLCHTALNGSCVLMMRQQGAVETAPALPLIAMGGVAAVAGIYGLRRVMQLRTGYARTLANRIAESASYSTPMAPPRSPITVE